MRIILDDVQFADALAHIHALANDLEVHHANLLILRRTERDGYRPNSMGGAGSPTNELDDDGTPIPQHSDPVGRLVVERDEARDPVGNALAQLVQHVHTARRNLEAAVGAGRKIEVPKKPDNPDDLWCENCLKRANVKEPKAQGARVCWWCRDEKSERGTYPSRRLIEAHGRGRVSPWQRTQIRLQDLEDVARLRAERKRAKREARGAA